jgi:hypothetical protein
MFTQYVSLYRSFFQSSVSSVLLFPRYWSVYIVSPHQDSPHVHTVRIFVPQFLSIVSLFGPALPSILVGVYCFLIHF